MELFFHLGARIKMKENQSAADQAPPPDNLNGLRQAITDRFPTLSKRLQDIARFALDCPNEMAIETVATIAGRAGVQPSAIIRFANSFGYSGFSEMQRIFQSSLLERVPSYNERLRRALALEHEGGPSSSAELLQEFCAANSVSLRHLSEVVPPAKLAEAIELLSAAKVVHLLGMRRSFPVAAYLAYALSHAECRTHLMTGVAGLLAEQGGLMTSDDVLVAISASPYAQETVATVEAAAAKGVRILAITDSQLSPIGRLATIAFHINDAELRGFRSLTATLCLAQTLAVGLALRAVKEN